MVRFNKQTVVKHLHKNRKAKWYVSGVGRYHFWDSEKRARTMQMENNICRDPIFTVPKEKDEWFTDISQLNDQDDRKDSPKTKTSGKRICVYPASFHDAIFTSNYPHGWPVHAHCWTIGERVMGPRLEEHLALLIKVLRTKWEEENLLEEARKIKRWVGGYTWPTEDEFEVWSRLVAISDPIAGRDVVELLCESQNEKQESLKNLRRQLRGQQYGKHILHLPYDIRIMVLDRLHGAHIRNVLEATGWHIDESYWRGRLPWNILWELNDMDQSA